MSDPRLCYIFTLNYDFIIFLKYFYLYYICLEPLVISNIIKSSHISHCTIVVYVYYVVIYKPTFVLLSTALEMLDIFREFLIVAGIEMQLMIQLLCGRHRTQKGRQFCLNDQRAGLF